MADFTPGPWHYRPRAFDDWGWVRDSNGDTVGHAHAPILPEVADAHRLAKTDPFEANGRLIAAAPELYSALRRLVADVAGCFGLEEAALRALLGNTNFDIIMEWVEEGRAALAKAEGREP